MRKILDRLFEPSTPAGLAMVTLGFGSIFKIDEAPVVAAAIEQVGATVAAMPTWQGLILGLLGAAAMFMPERGGK